MRMRAAHFLQSHLSLSGSEGLDDPQSRPQCILIMYASLHFGTWHFDDITWIDIVLLFCVTGSVEEHEKHLTFS